MEVDTLSLLFLLSVSLLSVFLLYQKRKTKQADLYKLPPGPKPFPIVGNLLQLCPISHPHITFTSLSKIYGPIFSLQLGQVTTIIISSRECAKQLFQNHDLALAGRHEPDAARVQAYHEWSIAWLPPGPRWRSLRRICTTELFTAQRLDSYVSVRKQKMQDLLNFISKSAKEGSLVEIGPAAFTTTLNLLSCTIFSTDFASFDSDSSHDFKKVVEETMVAGGSPNVSDIFPVLTSLDLQGVRRKLQPHNKFLRLVFNEQIDCRIKNRKEVSIACNDLLDVLLDSQFGANEQEHRQALISVFGDLFLAGTDTSSNTVEWAMAELLQNPVTMAALNYELASIIGPERDMEESDIGRLPYLQAVVKETLRMHPPVPFLLPRRAQETVIFGDYLIPEGAKLLVNVWAIGRDETTWPDPLKFRPERFLESDIDFKGRDFELIPFGAGRRICPGMPLAYRMVHLMLGSLLHRFEWKLPEEEAKNGLDMSEKFGVTLAMARHLKVIAIPISGLHIK
ncbi:Cytochrome P450 76C4 [Rhynchospora pubera]|uniref:Cytochrome P450 76C4 n=1 Tax=Rhynchospora pubera TaxID=906938 RepID=A0AAV8F8Z6_9POAL|nr:Cytochrome P450 76C4 [Rhynchospora pubera]